VAKDKKKKKKGKNASGSAAKAVTTLKSLTDNRVVADVIAAALVATASALQDTNKARRLAASAGDELEKLSKKGAEHGNAMWQLALDIGKRAMDSIVGEETPRPARRAAPRKAAAPRKTATAKKAAAPRKTATAKKAAAPRKAAAAPKRTSRSTGRTARKPAARKAN
jgi:hypothetical protein